MSAMASRLRDAGYIIPHVRFLTVAELLREVERRGFDPETTEVQVGREQVQLSDGWGVYRDGDGVAIVHFYTEDDDPGWDQLTAAVEGAA